MREETPLGGAAALRLLIVKPLHRLLPQGGSLPLEDWRRRHAGMLLVLWLNVVALPIYSVLAGHSSVVHDLDSGAALAVFAALGAARRLSRKVRTVSVSLGLLTAAALLVHASGGLIEAHFYFFVLIIVLTLYEDWLPFLLAVAFVLIHHGVLGTLDPRSVFDRPAEWAHPWKWAAVHAAFVAAAGVSAVIAWRLNEDVRSKMRAAHEELEVVSNTDTLTGLGNRRRLMVDLQEIFSSGRSAVMVILDLDGFKAYNDTFGHPAGDSLLARIGQRLKEAIDGRGHAYRLGGDEFCVIWTVDVADRAAAETACAATMRERGEGFSISAAYGSVAMPDEAATAEATLRIADQRMYRRKHESRPSAGSQSRSVLMQTLTERHPDLGSHVDVVTVLAEDVARRLGLAPHTIEQVRHAAQLHDIGKVAIPDAIVNKPGSLDAQEWEFMRRHTLIGERIVNADAALASLASLVRSSHEHYDGAGYPDALAGDEIPIGARIIAACDAFDAMTSHRPYRLARSPHEALAELQRCAGTQFDPDVVAALQALLDQPLVTGDHRPSSTNPNAPADPSAVH